MKLEHKFLYHRPFSDNSQETLIFELNHGWHILETFKQLDSSVVEILLSKVIHDGDE